MSEAIVRADGLRNVRHRFDTHAEHVCLEIWWDDSEGSHSLTLEDAKALSASKVLYAKRSEIERTEYLKQLICEERY